METIKEILDKKLKNNDKHICNIILEYVYHKCCICNELINGNFIIRYDDKFICKKKCYDAVDWKLCNCGKYYDRLNNIYCNACFGKCRIFCPNCLAEEYKEFTEFN